MLEFKILWNIIDYMEVHGLTSNVVRISIDQNFADEINAKSKTSFSVDELIKAANKCLANEWLERKELGAELRNLGITTKGIGVARSKAKSDEQKTSRSRLKKISDYIEEHKGLFIVLGFLIAVLTLISKFWGSNHG